MQIRHGAVLLGAVTALSLAACDRGATSNPNAPGSPGTGNAPEVRAPVAGDTPPGGPSGVKGSLPHPGSSGGDAVPGTTGSGAADSSRSQAAQPGSGLQGGLGRNQGMATSTPPGTGQAADGSTNRTSSGAVGQR